MQTDHFAVPARPTTAPARGVRAAEIAVEDFIVVVPFGRLPELLGRALVEAHGPQIAEQIANQVGRYAHIAGRAA